MSLGEQPLANALTTTASPADEPRYPLDLEICERCSLAQLAVSVPPSELFSDYVYFSSYSATVVDNAQRIVERVVQERALSSQDLVMEIGSNDGYLLRHYQDRGVTVLGVDPAENIASHAREQGIPTECAFFGVEVAKQLVSAGHRPAVMHANNVIAHIPDVNGVLSGIATLLRDDGVAIIETPYIRDLIENLEFDTIYHEHLYYYSVSSIEFLLRRNGLRLDRVEHLAIHGGSLRIFATLDDGRPPGASARRYLEEEAALRLTSPSYYEDFGRQVDALRERLRELLLGLRKDGASIAGYGAAAKATVLLNAIQIGSETLDFIADRNPHKQGHYLPGVGIPIVHADALVERRPDYVVLFVWNHASEILAQENQYQQHGGRFLLPIPEPKVVDPEEQPV